MSKLNEILADFPILKQAVESPDREQHEKDFSTLAFAFLQDRAVGLLPYLLGFEVVDRDEDGSKAVGIFGFNISGHYYYVPSFFINSQIKGMDLLFSKTTNNFMPLQEEWIDKIVNKSGVRLGKPVPADNVQGDFESPNLTDMIEPPMVGAKTASFTPTADLSARFAHEAWNSMQKAAEAALKSDEAFREAFGGALAAMSGEPLEKASSTAIIPFIANFGGPKARDALLNSLHNIKYANAFMGFYDDVKPFCVTKYAEELAPVEVKPELRVSENVQDVNADVSDDKANAREKARLITDGFAIIDKRKDSDKAVVYAEDLSGAFSAPDGPGVYETWTCDNVFKPLIAIPLAGSSWRGGMVFIDPQTHAHEITAPDGVITSRKLDKPVESFTRPISSMTAAPKNNNRSESNWGKSVYLIFDPVSKSGFIAHLDYRVSGEGGHTFYVYSFDGLPSGNKGPLFTASESFPRLSDCDGSGACRSDLVQGCCEPDKFLKVSTLAGGRIVRNRDTVIVPSNFRVIKLEGLGGNSRPVLGSQAALDEQLFAEGLRKIDVGFDDVDFSVRIDGRDSGRLSKKEACLKLVFDCGLSVPDADELLARAEAKSSVPVLAKMAQLVGVNMPMPVPPGPGSDPYSGMALPMEQPFIENQAGSFTGVPPLQDATQPDFAVGGQSEKEVAGGNGSQAVLPPDVMQLADQAAQAGQKHVFDHSTIAGLAGLYDMGYAIDMYIPELTKSLDRIGRILFIFYWKNDEFAERYGEQDLAGMEDLLRNVFKSFGSLVLRLQEKAVSEVKEVS